MSKIIGIDLGTSNSAAAVLEGGRPVIIPSSEGTTVGGGKAFPSYVAFTKDGQLIVGEPARRQAISNPEGTVTAFKRKMGTDYRSHPPRKEVPHRSSCRRSCFRRSSETRKRSSATRSRRP